MPNNPQKKKYEIDQCALYKCRSKKRLSYILNTSQDNLLHLHSNIQYHSFEIDKKNSTDKRTITAPNNEIKVIQKRILKLLQNIIRPDWLISGEKGKCYIDNGKTHIEGRYVLTIDIKKFYDNCEREYVFRFFLDKMKTAPDIAAILTDITTFNNGIPTGCPTSQMIAFFASV